MLNYKDFLYIPKVICSELISRYYDDLLANYFKIEKTQELIAEKYYRPTLQHDIEAYIYGCNVCWVLKAVRQKPYGDLQLLPVLTHQ